MHTNLSDEHSQRSGQYKLSTYCPLHRNCFTIQPKIVDKTFFKPYYPKDWRNDRHTEGCRHLENCGA